MRSLYPQTIFPLSNMLYSLNNKTRNPVTIMVSKRNYKKIYRRGCFSFLYRRKYSHKDFIMGVVSTSESMLTSISRPLQLQKKKKSFSLGHHKHLFGQSLSKPSTLKMLKLKSVKPCHNSSNAVLQKHRKKHLNKTLILTESCWLEIWHQFFYIFLNWSTCYVWYGRLLLESSDSKPLHKFENSVYGEF